MPWLVDYEGAKPLLMGVFCVCAEVQARGGAAKPRSLLLPARLTGHQYPWKGLERRVQRRNPRPWYLDGCKGTINYARP